MNSSTYFLLGCVLAISLAATVPTAYAQGDEAAFKSTYNPGGCTAEFCPLADVTGSRLEGIYSSTDLSSFVNKIFTFAISVGAILAVLRLGWAGYLYMTTESWGSMSRAKEVIGDVVLGLVLLLSIWLVLHQINPDILKLTLLENIQPLPSQTTTP